MIYKVLSLLGLFFGCLSILFDRLGEALFRLEERAIARARHHKHTCTAVARPNMSMRRY